MAGESRWEVVRADTSDNRSWLAGAPVCSLLATHHMAHLGRMWASPDFEVIRAEASGTFALIGLDGTGETLIDGTWRDVKPGQICLLPAFAHTGIRSKGTGTWKFAWVRYKESRETSPILSTNSPVLQNGDVDRLRCAITGLSGEVNAKSGAESGMLHHWVELIQGLVTQAARPYQDDDRLWRVWRKVENDLAYPWTLKDLAGIACMSEEHLRRLSRQQLGRSPVQHVTYLRIRRAVGLLTASNDKVETIAQAVGYESPFTFSNAFKRWTGKRPSDYRG